jgi:hypothetical protein
MYEHTSLFPAPDQDFHSLLAHSRTSEVLNLVDFSVNGDGENVPRGKQEPFKCMHNKAS